MKSAVCILAMVCALQSTCIAQIDPRASARSVPSASGSEGVMRDVPAMPSQQLPLIVLSKDYRVGPNDLLDIEIPDLDNFKRTVRVNAAGAISLPLVGSVLVAGYSAQEIEALPRIGPTLARRIVANRDSLGAFGSLDKLRRVKGMGPAALDRLAPLVTFGGRTARRAAPP